VPVQIQIRRGTQAEWDTADPVLAEGELAVELDQDRFKIGNGVQAYVDLPYSSGVQGPQGEVGVDGLGMYSTGTQLGVGSTTNVMVTNTTGRDLQLGDLVVSTHDQSIGRLARITALTGTPPGATVTTSTVGEIRGPQGYQGFQGHQSDRGNGFWPTVTEIGAGTTAAIAVDSTGVTGWVPEVNDLVVSLHANSPGVLGRITAVASATSVTVTNIGSIRGSQGVQGLEGLGIFTTATELTTGSTAAVNPVAVTGRVVKVGDLVMSTHTNSQGFYGRVTAVASQTSVTVQYLSTNRGPQGFQGLQGGPVPLGGTTMQALVKTSNADHALGWQAGLVPNGGTQWQVLAKSAATDQALTWRSSGIPTGGTTGQVLAKSSGTDLATLWRFATQVTASTSQRESSPPGYISVSPGSGEQVGFLQSYTLGPTDGLLLVSHIQASIHKTAASGAYSWLYHRLRVGNNNPAGASTDLVGHALFGYGNEITGWPVNTWVPYQLTLVSWLRPESTRTSQTYSTFLTVGQSGTISAQVLMIMSAHFIWRNAGAP
jgi:hypothetical protein